MGIRTRVADFLSNAWERATAYNDIYSLVFKTLALTTTGETDFFKAFTESCGRTLYEKKPLHLPYDQKVWAVASPAKGSSDKYTVTAYTQNLNTGSYYYKMNEKVHGNQVSYKDGRSLFTRDEAIEVLRTVEKQYQEAGYYQTGKQPPAGKLAVNLPLSGPAPSA